jgi:hypothetical protein
MPLSALGDADSTLEPFSPLWRSIAMLKAPFVCCPDQLIDLGLLVSRQDGNSRTFYSVPVPVDETHPPARVAQFCESII